MIQIIEASLIDRGRTAMFVKDSEGEKRDESWLEEERGNSVKGKDLTLQLDCSRFLIFPARSGAKNVATSTISHSLPRKIS
jgi:hypothetical protein